MRFWVTTHWPPREDEPAQSPTSGLWFPEGRHAHAKDVAVGDLVAIYQAKSGRTLLRTTAAGDISRVRCRKGREGVIALGRVTGLVAADDASEQETYADGSKIWWRWFAPVELISTSGFVSRPHLAIALGYKSNYGFRAFGTSQSGVKEVSEGIYTAIQSAFGLAQPAALPKPITMPGKLPVPGAGESDAHKLLKQFVAHDPAAALGVPD